MVNMYGIYFVHVELGTSKPTSNYSKEYDIDKGHSSQAPIPKQPISSNVKPTRKRRGVVEDDANAQERISSRLRQKPKSIGPNKRQRNEIDDVENPPKTLPGLPYAKSPFKAVRGEGNSFHGWST